jgi:hypothetical protein
MWVELVAKGLKSPTTRNFLSISRRGIILMGVMGVDGS